MSPTAPVVVTPPTAAAVPIDTVLNYLRLEPGTDEALILTLIEVATDLAERFLNRSLINRTLKLTLDRFPTSRCELWWDGIREGAISELTGSPAAIRLPRPPLVSVTSLITYAEDDQATTFPTSSYRINSSSAELVLKEGAVWPTALRNTGAIEITYVAGYGADSSFIPAAIRMGLMEQVAAMYDDRACGSLTEGAMAKLQPCRIMPQ